MNSLFNLCLDRINSFVKTNDEYFLENSTDYNNNNNNNLNENENDEDDDDEEYYNDNSFESINRSQDAPLSKLYEISTITKNRNNKNNNNNNNNKIKFYNTLIKALIERNKLSVDILYQLSLSIPLHFITFLDLKSNFVSNNHCLNISRIKTIRFLNLSNSNKLEDKGIKYLKGLPKLTELDISNCCRITNRSLKYISFMTRLEQLDISNNLNLNDQAFKYLMVLSRLKELVARNVPFTDHSICTQFQNQLNNYNDGGSISIQPFQSLSIINLSNSFISNQSLPIFLQFPSLSTIHLSNSKCTQIALNQFASSNTTSTCKINIIQNFMTIQLINNNNNNNNNNKDIDIDNNNKNDTNKSLKLNNKVWPVDQIIKVILTTTTNNNNNENNSNSTNTSLNTSFDSETSSSSLNLSNISNDDIDGDQVFKTPIKRSSNNISPLLLSSTNSSSGNRPTAFKSPLLNLFDENDFIGGGGGNGGGSGSGSGSGIKLPLIKDPFSRSPTKRTISKVHSSPSHLNIYNRFSSKITATTTTTQTQSPTSLNQQFAFSPLKVNSSIKKSGGFRTSQTPLISPKPSRKYDFSIYDCNDDDDDDEFSDQEKEIYNTPKKQKIKKQQQQKQQSLSQPLKLPKLNQSLLSPIILPLSNHQQPQTPKQPQPQISEQSKTPNQSPIQKTPKQSPEQQQQQQQQQQPPKTPNQSPIQKTLKQTPEQQPKTPNQKTPKQTPEEQQPKTPNQSPIQKTLKQTPEQQPKTPIQETLKQTPEQQPKTPNQSPIQKTPKQTPEEQQQQPKTPIQSPIQKTPKQTPEQQPKTPIQKTPQLPLLRQTPHRLRSSPQQQQQQIHTPLKNITPNKLSSIDINNFINISNNKNNHNNNNNNSNYTPSKYNCSPEYKQRESENGEIKLEDIEISVIIEPIVETPTKQSKKRKSYPLSASKNYGNYERIDSSQKISKLVFGE
ncbi:hypothetical protein ACTFIW_000248 [Dictyostelium discoideum]